MIATEGKTGDTPRILIVDDEPRMCESLEILLGSRGYSVKTFTDGRDALPYVRENGCDLALLDRLMPGMDGFSVMAQLKEGFPDLQVLIMTAYGSADSAVEAIKRGAYDYLCKPFDMDELTKRVENALNADRLAKEKARMKELLSETEHQLRQAQKIEAIGTLAGGIAHDFNNLLMGIQGHISLMQLSMGANHPFAERLGQVERLVERGSKLTSQLLGYARKGRFDIKIVKIHEIIRETADTFGRVRKEISVHFDFDPHVQPIEADPGQLEQVLMNLFINAADAMPQGGEITVRTRRTILEQLPGVPCQPKTGRYTLISVTDTGTGMDERTKERIFEPFFTTKEMGRGTGLGLASVYGIVKGHDGYIQVTSDLGRGTTFDLYFPISNTLGEAAGETPEEALLRGDETVLFVDDEEHILDIGRAFMEVMGYKVVTAQNGSDALDLYRQMHRDIDIVLLDMIMPGLNGHRIFEELKSIDPDVKVLLMSGYNRDRDQTAHLAERCNGFIQKPFKIQDLSHRLRQALSDRTPD